MADEFQESEVFFENNAAGIEDGYNNDNHQLRFRDPKRINNKSQKQKKKKKKKKKSIPVNIPEEKLSMKSRNQCNYEEEEEEDGDGEIVPPHVVVGRRRVGGEMMACSVCYGNGRTLKGRDLSQVRNSVLKMTGFLET